ncbi:MAG TPA: DUF2809 domain-containing protein [Oculatellaceae cyanobacterium]|jgi:hypothetical protein
MTQFNKQHLYTLASLLIILPLGLLSKLYSGPGQQWLNNYAGDVFYEIFWCLFLSLFYFKSISLKKIPLWVFSVTCVIEFLQLWHPPWLQRVRSYFLMKLLLGTTFSWWDFPHYLLGSVIGWLWIRKIYQPNEKTSKG